MGNTMCWVCISHCRHHYTSALSPSNRVGICRLQRVHLVGRAIDVRVHTGVLQKLPGLYALFELLFANEVVVDPVLSTGKQASILHCHQNEPKSNVVPDTGHQTIVLHKYCAPAPLAVANVSYGNKRSQTGENFPSVS